MYSLHACWRRLLPRRAKISPVSTQARALRICLSRLDTGSTIAWAANPSEAPMSGVKRGRQGTQTSVVEKSPARKKREAERKRRQEERWTKESGTVVERSIEYLSDEERRQLGF